MGVLRVVSIIVNLNFSLLGLMYLSFLLYMSFGDLTGYLMGSLSALCAYSYVRQIAGVANA